MSKITQLEIGKKYLIGGKNVVVRVSAGDGCVRCAYLMQCARFTVKSPLKDYHTLCGSIYRDDRQSLIFYDIDQNKPQI